MTKADVIALLNQLEPSVDHSSLAGHALIAAKKQCHIVPLKNKSQLIQALQQVAGTEMAEASDAVQHAALKAAQEALEAAANNIVLLLPHGYPDFLAALKQAEMQLAASQGSHRSRWSVGYDDGWHSVHTIYGREPGSGDRAGGGASRGRGGEKGRSGGSGEGGTGRTPAAGMGYTWSLAMTPSSGSLSPFLSTC